jgi:hypothetical protein
MTRTLGAGTWRWRDQCEAPLDPYIDGFAAQLDERGYARATQKEQRRIVGDFSLWLGGRRLGVGDLDEGRTAEFVRDRCRSGRVQRGDRPTLRMLLGHLRQLRVIGAPTATITPTPLSSVEQTFSQYLTHQRGLTRATLLNYLPTVRQFVSERFGTESICFDDIRAPDITRFVSRHAHARSPGRAKLMVTALRSFFHFLRLRGRHGPRSRVVGTCGGGLAACGGAATRDLRDASETLVDAL